VILNCSLTTVAKSKCGRQYLEQNQQIYLVMDYVLTSVGILSLFSIRNTTFIYKELLLFYCGTVSSLLISVLFGKQSVWSPVGRRGSWLCCL